MTTKFSKDKLIDAYPFWMDRTLRRMKQISGQRFQQLGIDLTVDQWVILKRIAEEEGASQTAVADQTFKDAPTVTRIIDLLCKKALVERRPSSIDRRRFELYLTAIGKKTYEALMPEIVELRSKGLKGISKQELQTLREVLQKIYQNLE